MASKDELIFESSFVIVAIDIPEVIRHCYQDINEDGVESNLSDDLEHLNLIQPLLPHSVQHDLVWRLVQKFAYLASTWGFLCPLYRVY